MARVAVPTHAKRARSSTERNPRLEQSVSDASLRGKRGKLGTYNGHRCGAHCKIHRCFMHCAFIDKSSRAVKYTFHRTYHFESQENVLGRAILQFPIVFVGFRAKILLFSMPDLGLERLPAGVAS